MDAKMEEDEAVTSTAAASTSSEATLVAVAEDEEDCSRLKTRSTWTELKQKVRDFRRQFFVYRSPSGFQFRPLNDERTRLYFLANPSIGRETTLLYVDILSTKSENIGAGIGSGVGGESKQMHWNALIESSFQVLPSNGKLSKEEQLLSERKRCVTWGITTFEMEETTGKFIFPAAGSLYGCVDSGWTNGGGGGPLFPYEIKSQCQGARLYASMCPTNPDLIASVINGDIWLSHTVTGQEVRATYCHHGHESLADDPLTGGLPAYLTQEEFDRFTGLWWRTISENGEYQILYEEVDESEVELAKFPHPSGNDVEEFRFPRAGTDNAKSTLKLIKFRLEPSSLEIIDLRQFELKTPLENFFPWMEYLVRVGWLNDGQHIWAQILNRRQNLIELIMLHVDSFVPVQDDSNPNLAMSNGCIHPLPQLQVLCSVRSDNWITVNDILTFLPPPEDEPNHIRFIWATEDTGWRHLYLYTVLGNKGGRSEMTSESCLRPRIISKVALTAGEWSVINKPIYVDLKYGLVYFHAVKDTPLEKHLYVVSMDHPGKIRRLTTSGYSHSAHLDDECSLFVTVFSSIQSVPGCQIFRITHTDSTVNGISLTPAGWLLQQRSPDKDYQSPELFSHIISSGDKLYGMIFKPHKVVPGVKYPVVLSIYGGPMVQLVSNTYKGMRQMRDHLLASRGYCVICIDSRGSQNRGMAFESHIKNRMGQVEVKDQVEVLEWLASVTGYMDMNRVAVHGWSYGGYLALMALVQYPKLFRVAIAGAPVTSWNLYDTGYTERYMDLPSQNPRGYKLGSILSYVGDFPDEPNRLLIVHGIMDENVHFFQHTSQLISQLVKYGKPYQIQIYPGERHSLRHLEASDHYETTLLSFLQSNL